MRRTGWGVAALLAVAIASSGCLGVGRNFTAAPIKSIEKGVTTKEDVRKAFGDPFREGLDDGYESWQYVYNRWRMFGPAYSKDLYIVFNKDGTVRGYTFNSNLDDVSGSN